MLPRTVTHHIEGSHIGGQDLVDIIFEVEFDISGKKIRVIGVKPSQEKGYLLQDPNWKGWENSMTKFARKNGEKMLRDYGLIPTNNQNQESNGTGLEKLGWTPSFA